MARVWQLLVRADGDTRAAQREMRKLQRSFKRYGQNLKTAGRHLTYAVTAPVIATAAIGVREMMEQQKATAATNAVLKSTGKIGQISAKHVEDLATKFQNMSGIEDDVIQSSENVLLRFDGINKSNFDKVSQSLADMQAAGKSGAAAATALGVAYTQPEKAGMRLKKLGVVLTATEEAFIKKLVKHHKVSRAQEIIQGRINKAYAGQAKALGNASPLQRIQRLYEDFAETFGKMLLPAIVAFSKWFGKLSERFQQLSPRMQRLIGIGALVAAALGPILLIAGSLVTAIGALLPVIVSLINPWTLVAVAVAAVGVAWLRQGNHMQQAKELFMRVVAYVRDVAWPAMVDSARKAMAWYQSNVAPTINRVVSEITKTLSVWGGWARAFWRKWGADIMRVVRPAFNLVKGNIKNAIKVIGQIISFYLRVLRGDWRGAWNSLKGIVHTGLNAAKEAISNAIPGFGAIVKALFKASLEINTWVMNKALALGKSIVNGIAKEVRKGGSAIEGAIKQAITGAIDNGAFGIGGMIAAKVSKAMRNKSVGDKRHGGFSGAQEKVILALSIDKYERQIANAENVLANKKKKYEKRAREYQAALKTKHNKHDDARTKRQMLAAEKQYKAAQKFLAAANKAAQAFSNIGMKYDLKQALFDYQTALNGGVVDTAKQLKIFQDEYAALLKKFNEQMSNLGSQQKVDILQQMTELLNMIRELSPDATPTVTPTATTPTPSGGPTWEGSNRSRSRGAGASGMVFNVYPQSQDVEAIARRVAYIISSGKVRVAG